MYKPGERPLDLKQAATEEKPGDISVSTE